MICTCLISSPLHGFHFTTRKWLKMKGTLERKSWTCDYLVIITQYVMLLCNHINCRGTAPSPRFNHVAALYDDKILYIFGGSSKSRTLNDLYSLDFETVSKLCRSKCVYIYTAIPCGWILHRPFNLIKMYISSDGMVESKDTRFSSITQSWLLWCPMWH